MFKTLLAAAGVPVALFALAAMPAQAACDAGKSGDDLTGAEAEAVYSCLADDLLAGYAKGGKGYIPADRVADYRSWTRASSFPAAPGFHSGRFLVTWVNATGADAYMEYSDTPAIPAGTLLAKESFSVNETGAVTPGPLFFMEKVADGTSPETMDWYYYAVAANGRPMAVNVMQACNDCHVGNFGGQGGMGYPVEDARITN